MKSLNKESNSTVRLKTRKRAKYKPVDNFLREKLINLVQNEKLQLKQASDILNLNYSTAKTIVRVWKRENRVAKKKKKKNFITAKSKYPSDIELAKDSSTQQNKKIFQTFNINDSETINNSNQALSFNSNNKNKTNNSHNKSNNINNFPLIKSKRFINKLSESNNILLSLKKNNSLETQKKLINNDENMYFRKYRFRPRRIKGEENLNTSNFSFALFPIDANDYNSKNQGCKSCTNHKILNTSDYEINKKNEVEAAGREAVHSQEGCFNQTNYHNCLCNCRHDLFNIYNQNNQICHNQSFVIENKNANNIYFEYLKLKNFYENKNLMQNHSFNLTNNDRNFNVNINSNYSSNMNNVSNPNSILLIQNLFSEICILQNTINQINSSLTINYNYLNLLINLLIPR